MTARKLRLGTRRSLLAQAQSRWVADQLTAAHPDCEVELVPIETRGDRITDVPLSTVEGKAFFTAELDAALLEHRIDFSVHSLKDLSLDLPPGIVIGAIPPRENPRDVVLFRPDVIERLAAGETLRIGTSAPRRLENVPELLRWALPGSRASLQFVEIRGNVDTRLGRLHEDDNSERRLDGVVLAFAGLIRCGRGRERLGALLDGLLWMILPLEQCPAAPGQGALAVECRSDDAAMRALLESLHDAQTARQVQRERAVLAEFGGGCHQRFGAVCITHPACGDVLYIRGKDPQNRPLAASQWLSLPPNPSGEVVAWDGVQAREASDHQGALDDMIEAALAASTAPVFVAHSRALPPGAESCLDHRRVWTSGVASWRRLAERGVWVEGCGEALGFEWIAPTLSEPVLQLPPLEEWQILTHAAAVESWPAGSVLATYTLPQEDAPQIAGAGSVTHAFWASGSQFMRLGGRLPSSVQHACGPGKTAELLSGAGVQHLTIFPSVSEWRTWLTNKDT